MKFISKRRSLAWWVVAVPIGMSMMSCRIAIADEQVPVPWNGMDIGGLSPAGASQASNGTFTLTGGGGDLSGAQDAFQFVYQSLTGDCTLSARVSAGGDPNSLADAGLMVRDALATTSNFAAVVLAPGHSVLSTYRTECVPLTGAESVDGDAPVWVKLIKRGAVVRSYVAADHGGAPGVWRQIGGSEPVASGMIYIGLCLAGRSQASAAAATFDHVSLVTGEQPLLDNGLYTLSPADAPGMVLVSDGARVSLTAQNGNPNQAWRLVNKGGGFYSLQPSAGDALALTVSGPKPDNGTKVAVAADQGQDAQQWSIVVNRNDTYSLLPRFDLSVGLDDFDGDTGPDAVIDIWGYNSSDPHLQWTLDPA